METATLSGAMLLSQYGLHVVKLHYPIFRDGQVFCSCENPGCRSQGKHPVGAQWGKSATRDQEVIQDIWSRAPWNVGILLGLAHGIPESEAVIDIEDDTLEGRNLAETILGEYPTVTYSSGKSLHRLYRWCPGLPQVANLTINGLEFRLGVKGKETQSVAPPSKHPNGQQYKFLQGRGLGEIPIAELPPHIVEWVNSEYVRQQSAPGAAPSSADHRRFNIPGRKVQSPGRNNALLRHANGCWRTACKLHGINGLEDPETRDQVWLWIWGANLATCDPPLDEGECWTIFQHSEKFMLPELRREAAEKRKQAEEAVEQAPQESQTDDGREFGLYLKRSGIRIVLDPRMADGEESPDTVNEWVCDWRLRYLQNTEKQTSMLQIQQWEIEMLEVDLDRPGTVARKIYQHTGGQVKLDRSFAFWCWKDIWLGRSTKKSGITRGLKEYLLNNAEVHDSGEAGLKGMIEDLVSGLVGPVGTIARGVQEYRELGAPLVELKDRLKLTPGGDISTTWIEGDPRSGVYEMDGKLVVGVKIDEISKRYGATYGRGTVSASDIGKVLAELGFVRKFLKSGPLEGRAWVRAVE